MKYSAEGVGINQSTGDYGDISADKKKKKKKRKKMQ